MPISASPTTEVLERARIAVLRPAPLPFDEHAPHLRTPCTACQMLELCAPCSLTSVAAPGWPPALFARRRIPAGGTLYAQGEPQEFVYAVRSGTFKSTLALPDGREQICGFPMAGDVMALDGLAAGTHATTTTAIEDSHVCAVGPSPLLESIAQDPALRRRVNQLMGQEIVRGHHLMMLLGTMNARERLAAFLLDLSQRLSAQGYSARDFNLRMTRADIGSFLGMKLETVSRTLSALQDQGQIRVEHRRIRFVDREAFARRYEALRQT